MPTVLKSGRLSLLELSGPVQACNGNALPLSATLPLISGILLSNGAKYRVFYYTVFECVDLDYLHLISHYKALFIYLSIYQCLKKKLKREIKL